MTHQGLEKLPTASSLQPVVASYTAIARFLHWFMAFALVAMFSLGTYMADLAISPDKLRLYAWHKWAGVCIFGLAALRLAWRIAHRPPALPASMSATDRRLAHGGHGLLYLFMFAVPLSGWLMSSAYGFQTVVFGLWPLPDLLEKNEELAKLLKTVHWGVNLLFATLVLGHVAAALKHQFVNKDDVMRRMFSATGSNSLSRR